MRACERCKKRRNAANVGSEDSSAIRDSTPLESRPWLAGAAGAVVMVAMAVSRRHRQRTKFWGPNSRFQLFLDNDIIAGKALQTTLSWEKVS